MDSFSEGTAQGSFDFTLCSDPGDAQAPPSVAFSPDHPTLSIEVWRDDVSRSTTVGREEQHPLIGEDTHISEVRFSILGTCAPLRAHGQGAGDQASPPVLVTSSRRGVFDDGICGRALSVSSPHQPVPNSG
jgi:hypothetical protein